MAAGIKRANRESEYTPAQLLELDRCRKDPVYFIKNYVKIQHPTRGSVQFDLYDYQLEMLDAIHTHKDTVLLCSRQLGKTTVVSMYILWLTTFSDDVVAVIASKAMAHATEIMSRIKYAYEELPDWIKAGCKFYNRTSIEFDNGSKIKSEATTEKTGRGSSPTIVFLDEIAFISKRIQDELWASLAPSLSTGGKFILTSTPNGDDELFANLWRGACSGQNSFFPLKVLWYQHPDRDQSYYDEMKGKLGPVKARQELDCVTGETEITIRNKRSGEIESVSISDFTKKLEEKNVLEGKSRTDVNFIENEDFEILTPDGFKDFEGIITQKKQGIIGIELENGSTLRGTTTHKIKTTNGFVSLNNTQLGNEVFTENGISKINNIKIEHVAELVYDPFEVGTKHEYISNGIVSHNCEFLSSDSLLVDPIKLNQIRTSHPIFEKEEFKFFLCEEEIKKVPIFLVGVDPATGSGQDSSVIEVFSFPDLIQVAEFRNNKLIIPFLYKKIKWILEYLTSIKHKNNSRPEVFWSFERNAIGEAISALYFNDDKPNDLAELVVDEPGKYGMYTSGKSKIQAALKLKTMIEKVSGFTISSELLLFELKNYAGKGKGYEAKPGATDDAVSACLIAIRILDYLSKFNVDAHSTIYDYDYEEEIDEPMPFAIL